MCSSPGTVFSWFGAIFINISFGFLIAWGVTTNWILGLILSFIYSCVLFLISFKLSKHVVGNSTVPEISAGENEETTASNDATKQGLRTLVTLLYSLAVISVGVTGLIIPMNVFYCDDESGYAFYDTYNWYTNESSLPSDAQQWYESIKDGSIYNTYDKKNFATLPNSNILLFTGNDATNSGVDLLYSYNGTSLTPFNFRHPSSFVVTLDNTSICMTGNIDSFVDHTTSTIACYSGENLRFTTKYNNFNQDYGDFHSPSYLYPSTNNTIWFTASSLNRYSYASSPVFSLNDQTMKLTLHSTFSNNNIKKCSMDYIARYRALVSIFTSILPTFIIATILHYKLKFVPTMPIIMYITTTTFLVSVILSIEPNYNNMDMVLKIWLPGTSGLWMICLVILFLVNGVSSNDNGNSNVKEMKSPYFVWNINFTALVFFFTMAWSLGIPVPNYDIWWRWVIVNIIVYIPYIFTGIILESILLVILGAIGIFGDVWRFSDLIAVHINESFQVIIQVVLFAIIGVFIGVLGWKINQYQKDLQVFVFGWMNRHFSFRLNQNRDEREDILQNNDEESTSSNDEKDGVHTGVAIF